MLFVVVSKTFSWYYFGHVFLWPLNTHQCPCPLYVVLLCGTVHHEKIAQFSFTAVSQVAVCFCFSLHLIAGLVLAFECQALTRRHVGVWLATAAQDCGRVATEIQMELSYTHSIESHNYIDSTVEWGEFPKRCLYKATTFKKWDL